jgi:hypothetical protein
MFCAPLPWSKAPGLKRAAIKLSILLSDMRNRLGNVVFSKWKKTNYVRQYVTYSRGSTPRQAEVRSAFSLLVKVWKKTRRLMQSSWNLFSTGQNMTGRNAFIGANVTRVIAGEALELFKPMGEEPLASFSAQAGATAGGIMCSFTLPPGSADKHFFFFTQLKDAGKGTGDIKRHDAGVNPASPFELQGLEPGAEYFVYAVLAEDEYANAVKASEAVTVGV